MLLADEIQSGMGRTGEWCAYQHYGILPDVTTLAKPLGGGIPIGAMLCTEEAARAFTPGMHGTTFGGGPLACAVAIAVIDTMRRENLLDHIPRDGQIFLRTQLQSLAASHSAIMDVRGTGLMLGMEIECRIGKHVAAQMLERHILSIAPARQCCGFCRPSLSSATHIDQAVQALDEILTSAAAANLEQRAMTSKAHA